MSDDRQFGEGQDNYLQGIRSAAEAAKQAGSAAGSVGTAAGEATANAAAATVQAGMETGKAASEIAVGTAAGGPWGAVLSAAWSLRHTLFKVLVFLCLFLLFIIITVVSLPSIVFNNIFHTDPTTVDPNGPTEMTAIFDDLSATVADCIQAGYDAALAEVDEIIADGGYDYDLSMEALVNNALVSMDYDTCYILAAYSASMGQRGTTKADLQSKLNAVTDQMYTVTYEVKSTQVPVENEGGDGETQETVQYVACTIHPFDQSIILKAFDVDVDATYDQFQISYGDAILNMSNALKMTMYGTASNGSVPPISDAELNLFLASLDCSGKRKELMRCALSLVGRVPYFWGGKSAPGWNEEWNTPKLVTAAGSSSTGTIRPYGLDCSGFTEWVYQTALGVTLYDGSWNQWDATHAISEDELLPGDLGFMAVPGTVPVNHVLLYAGEDADGTKLWVHCASGTGVVLNSPDYVTQYRRRNDIDLEGDLPLADITEEIGYDREFSNVYTIPPNYTDSGKLLGGLLETRNTVEACILLLLVGYPELMWMHLPATAKVVVMTVTLLPLGVFALMGIGGDSLLRFVTNMVLFWVRRRRLHYRRIGYHYGTTVTHRKRPSAQKPRPSEKSSRPSGVRTGLHSPQRDQKRDR